MFYMFSFLYPLCLVRAVVMTEELEALDILLIQSDNGKYEVEKTHSPRPEVVSATSSTAIPSCCGKQTCHMSSDYALSNASSHLTSSFSPSSILSVSAPSELSNSLQTQIDRLKVECLSTCLMVCLQRLDLSTICRAHEEIIETQAQVASPLSLETKRGQNAKNLKNFPCLVDTKAAENSSGSELHTGGLSASFMLSAISPASITSPSKMSVASEHNDRCASRKVCVSGLNSSRWSKTIMGEQNRKQRQDETRVKPGDFSSNNLLPAGADSYMGVMYYFY